MCLLFLVGSHNRVVAVHRLVVIVLFLLLWRPDQLWLEHVFSDRGPSLHRGDRRDEGALDLVCLRSVPVEVRAVPGDSLVDDWVWLLPLWRWGVRVVESVRLPWLIVLGALPGPLQGEQRWVVWNSSLDE